jgi:hypothetical protein
MYFGFYNMFVNPMRTCPKSNDSFQKLKKNEISNLIFTNDRIRSIKVFFMIFTKARVGSIIFSSIFTDTRVRSIELF